MESHSNKTGIRKEVMGIFSPILTVREADDLLARLQKTKAAIYQENGSEAAWQENLNPEEHARLISYASQAGLDLKKTPVAENLINAWKVEIQSWPVLKVILAKDVASKYIGQLKTYFEQNWLTQMPLRLNLEVDRNLIGGVAVEWAGRVYDRSWREKREEIINAVLRVSD